MASAEETNTCLSSENINRLLFLTQKYLEEQNISAKNVSISKRNRELCDGDYCVPKGCLEIGDEEYKAVCLKLKEKSELCPLQLKDVKPTQHYSLAYYLDRSSTFRHVLSTYWTQNFNVFNAHMPKNQHIILNPSDFHRSGRNAAIKMCLGDLRAAVLLQHVGLLLQCAGFKVSYVKHSQQFNDIFNLIGMTVDAFQIDDFNPWEKGLMTGLIDKIKSSGYAVQVSTKRVTNKTVHSESGDDLMMEVLDSGNYESQKDTSDKNVLALCDNKEQTVQESLILKLGDYIADNKITLGKGCFDKNIKNVDVMTHDGVSDVLCQTCCIQCIKKEVRDATSVIHIVSGSRSFSQQKVDLMCRVIWPENPVPQCHLVFGHVQARQMSNLDIQTVDEFVKLRQKQMQDAAVLKYGDEVKGKGWEETIMALTVAGMKFELLQPLHKNPVKLDLSDGSELGRGIDNRSGAFVMYNCARLATLFSHFDQAVDKGLYPPLPNIEEVNFSLLREEDEWFLLFQYVLPYNDLLKEILEQVVPCSGQISSIIHTHKICSFLTTLSRSLSSYYRRTHVLAENRPHLLPVMYARLYLLKVVHKILIHALSLMGISPLNQL